MKYLFGRPVNEPKAVIIQPIISEGSKLEYGEEKQIMDVVEKNLEKINDFCSDLISGKIQIA